MGELESANYRLHLRHSFQLPVRSDERHSGLQRRHFAAGEECSTLNVQINGTIDHIEHVVAGSHLWLDSKTDPEMSNRQRELRKTAADTALSRQRTKGLS